MRTRIMVPGLAVACLALFAIVAVTGVSKSDEPATPSDPAKPAAASASIGTPDSSRWTATTYEAAATEANKQVLASGKPVTLTGEIVDVSCYLQLGKRGAGHVACGSKCIEHGQPIGIVDSDDKLTILFAEEHHPRRDGQVDVRKVFAPHLAQTVTVSGMMTEMKDYRALFVRVADIGGGVKARKAATKK